MSNQTKSEVHQTVQDRRDHGNLTRTTERLHVSQSSLSSQIKHLEQRLGHPLFERAGRSLILTEAGRIVLDHADRIFTTGAALSLDLVLTTDPPTRLGSRSFVAHRIAEQPVRLHAVPERLNHKTLKAVFANEPFILPTEGTIRSGFIGLSARIGRNAQIAAEVDDMAMVRLLAREGVGVAIAPSVVFADEIAAGAIVTASLDLKITEVFYAVTITRTFPHPTLAQLLTLAEA